MSRRLRFAIGLAGGLVVEILHAGTYFRTVECDVVTPCTAGRPSSDNTVIINRDGVVFPISYNELGGSANIKVCVESALGTKLDEAVAWAVEKWNALVPQTENCVRCISNEEIDTFSGGGYNLASVVLHEIGHCAIGIDHTTLIIGEPPPVPAPPRVPTSWTSSYNTPIIGPNDGSDNVRGSKDDMQLAAGGGVATNVFWFRIADNDPTVIDATAIDINTFHYNESLLTGTAGTWPANANHWVTSGRPGFAGPVISGVRETVAVMSDTQSRTSAFFDLTADDVNMVKMSRTGIDRTIGGVDDHAIGIDLVSCAGAWDIKIKVGTTVLPTSLGECTAPVDFVFPGGPHSSAQDYKILGPTTLVLRNTVAWELGIPVFWNGFESGTTNHWSGVTP